MGEIVPMQRHRPHRRPQGARHGRVFTPRMSGSGLVSVALVAAVGLIGTWDFFAPLETTSQVVTLAGAKGCYPSYVGRCLPVGRDIDCDQVVGIVRVVGPDVYRLDADGDGEGCELMLR